MKTATRGPKTAQILGMPRRHVTRKHRRDRTGLWLGLCFAGDLRRWRQSQNRRARATARVRATARCRYRCTGKRWRCRASQASATGCCAHTSRLARDTGQAKTFAADFVALLMLGAQSQRVSACKCCGNTTSSLRARATPVFAHELLLRHRGHHLVLLKLHGELALSLRHGAELGGVAEHPTQRHGGQDRRGLLVQGRGGVDRALPLVQCLQRLRLELRGEGHLNTHQRLQDLRRSVSVGGLESSGGCGLESLVGRIHIVGRTVLEDDAHVDHLVTREQALGGCCPETLLDGGNVVWGDLIASELADEYDAILL